MVSVEEQKKEKRKCHDCGVDVGQHHEPGCDTERCPKCCGQLISCGCFVKYTDEDINNDEGTFDEEEFDKYEPDVWSGIMYEEGHILAEEKGWYSKFIKGLGWVECDKDDPDGSHDLNKACDYVMNNWKPRLKKK